MATSLYLFVPLILLVCGQALYYIFRAHWKPAVHTEGEIMDWLSLVTQHTYISAVVPCHYKCILIHGLQLAVHIYLIILVILMLLKKLNPAADSTVYEAVIVLVAAIVPQAIRPFFTWFFYHFTPDQEILMEGIYARQRQDTTTAKDFYEGAAGRNGGYSNGKDQRNGGVSAAALDVLDNIVFDEDELGSQYTDYEDDQLPYDQYDQRWNPDQDIVDHEIDEVVPDYQDVQFADDGERSVVHSDYNEDLAFVGLYRPAEGTPRKRGLIGGVRGTKKQQPRRPVDPYAEFDEEFADPADNTAYLYGHLAASEDLDEDLDPFQDHDAEEALRRMRSLRARVEPPVSETAYDPRYIPDPAVRPHDLEEEDIQQHAEHHRADRLEMTQGRTGALSRGGAGGVDRHHHPATRAPQREDGVDAMERTLARSGVVRAATPQEEPLASSYVARHGGGIHDARYRTSSENQLRRKASVDSLPDQVDDNDQLDNHRPNDRRHTLAATDDETQSVQSAVREYDPYTGKWIERKKQQQDGSVTDGDRYSPVAAGGSKGSRGVTPFDDVNSVGAGANLYASTALSQHVDEVFDYDNAATQHDETVTASQYDDFDQRDDDDEQLQQEEDQYGEGDNSRPITTASGSIHPLVPRLRLDMTMKKSDPIADDDQFDHLHANGGGGGQSYSGKPPPENEFKKLWYESGARAVQADNNFEYFNGNGGVQYDQNVPEVSDDGYNSVGGGNLEGEPLWVPIYTWHKYGLAMLLLILVVILIGDYALIVELNNNSATAANMFVKVLGLTIVVDIVFVQQVYLGFILVHRYLMSDEYDEQQKCFLHPYDGEYREF